MGIQLGTFYLKLSWAFILLSDYCILLKYFGYFQIRKKCESYFTTVISGQLFYQTVNLINGLNLNTLLNNILQQILCRIINNMH